MAPMHVGLKVALASVLLSTTFVSAEQPVRQESPKSANADAQRVSRDVLTVIEGVVLDGERRPLPNTRLRLRNLDVNEIERRATSNARGQFTFVVRPEIPYVVEVADPSGRILAVGDVITARAGEVAGTLVVLPARLPAIGAVFGETAASVIAAATSIGITVMDPTLPKVSPTR